MASEPYFNYAGLADLSFYMRIFNIAVIGYIFKNTIVSLVKAANVKLLYVPAAFALLRPLQRRQLKVELRRQGSIIGTRMPLN